MKIKKRLLPACIFVGILLFLTVGFLVAGGIMSAMGFGISVGRLYLTQGKTFLVDGGDAIILSDQSGDGDLFAKLSTGDLILVVHDGVEESYPARTGAHKVFRIQKGDESDLPEDLYVGMEYYGGGEWGEDPVRKAKECDFSVQYVRTGGGDENAEYPIVEIIRSKEALNAYYEDHKYLYDLERRDDPGSDFTVGFLDACDKYDDAYFEKQILLMVLLREGSGSNRHQVKGVGLSEKDGKEKIIVEIDTIVPEVGTCDEALWHVLIEPESGVDVSSSQDVTVYLDGVDPHHLPNHVRYSKGSANISLKIPVDWEYEVKDEDNATEFTIDFWPTGHAEGKLRARFYSAFGVCGTGLEQKKIYLGDYEAHKSTYDGKKVWDFIILENTAGSYVIMNEGAEAWWDEFGDEAMRILGTIVVGEGIISESEATEIAKKEVTVEYDRTRASFNSETGVWTVTCYMQNRAGREQVIVLTSEGKVIDVSYGD